MGDANLNPSPSTDPSLVFNEDCSVVIRRIHVHFAMSQGDISDDNQAHFGTGAYPGKLSLGSLHRLMAERLRFA